MEDWQREQIKTNLSSLVNNTCINAVFLAELQQEDVLSEIDVAQIVAKETNYDQAKLLYEIIVTKANSYYTLIKALTDTQQSGATKYLFHPSEKIRNLEVFFQEKTQQLGNLLSSNQIEAIHTWLLNSTFSDPERKEIAQILNDQKEVKLLRDTIPKKYALYIPRFVSVAQIVDPNLFQKSCSDTFVFKNVERSNLINYVNSYEIESSTRLLLRKKISTRFIFLESENDWKKICAKKAETPVHLLKYDEETENFVVEATSGGSEILREHLQNKHWTPEYISEEDFVEQIITENIKGACICDLPGMGKSDLLASLARRISEKSPETITSFIQLKDLVIPKYLSDCKKIILDHISTSKLASQILYELTKDGIIQFNLFFDGLDEVHGKKLQSMTNFLHDINESIPEARLFVTSRPVVRAELEKSVGLIAYDVLPFNEETQRNYITAYWLQENPKSDKGKLIEFANFCVQKVKQVLKANTINVSGVPLQCHLIAQVYSNQAAVYADKYRKTDVNLPKNIANSLTEIYSKFMLRQLGPSKCRFACMHKLVTSDNSQCDAVCKVKSFHVWQALQLIYWDFANEMMYKEYVADFSDLSPNQILSPGILKGGKSKDTYEFLHRTFAEFLMAEYIAQVLFTKPRDLKRNKTYDKIAEKFSLDELLDRYSVFRRETWETNGSFEFYRFKESILLYFINVSLAECLCAGDKLCVGVLAPVYNNYLFAKVAGCLHADYKSILKVLLQGIQNFEHQSRSWLHKVVRVMEREKKWEVNTNSVLNVFQVAAQYSDAKAIQQVYQFFQNELQFDFTKFTKFEADPYTPLPIQVAVKRGDFLVVEYLSNKFSLKNMNLLYWCFKDTYYKNEEGVHTRLKIAQLLVSKQADLLTEEAINPSTKVNLPLILSPNIHLKAVHFLVKAGVSVKAVDKWHTNVYINALDYMSDEDFENLQKFLFVECNAKDWFLALENYKNSFCPYGFFEIQNKVNTVRSFLNKMLKEAVLMHKSQNAKATLLRSEFYTSLFFYAVAAGILEIVNYFLEQDSTFLEQRHSEEHPNALVHPSNFRQLNSRESIDSEMLNSQLEQMRHSENVTPILLAAQFGQAEMVKFLVNQGANIFAVDGKGRTILHLAPISSKSQAFEQIVRIVSEKRDTSLPSYQKYMSSETEPKNLHELFSWHDNAITPSC